MRWERAAKDALLERFFDEDEEWAGEGGGEGGGGRGGGRGDGGAGGEGRGGRGEGRTGADTDDEEWRRAEWERQWGLKERVEARARREATRIMVEAHERAMQARRTPPGEGHAREDGVQRMQQEDTQRTPTQQRPQSSVQQHPQPSVQSSHPRPSVQPTWQATVDQSLALTHAFKQALFTLPPDVRENYLRSLPPHESLVLQKQLCDIPENWVPAGHEARQSPPPPTQHQEQVVEVPFRTQVQEPQQQRDQVMQSPPRARPPPQAQPRPLQDLTTLMDPQLQQLQAHVLQQEPVHPPPTQQPAPAPSQLPAPPSQLASSAQQPAPSAQPSAPSAQPPASSPSNQHVDSSGTHRTSPVTTT
ncbi:hypothetical protein GGF50DRAFT_63591 [Schizophyllum commune]